MVKVQADEEMAYGTFEKGPRRRLAWRLVPLASIAVCMLMVALVTTHRDGTQQVLLGEVARFERHESSQATPTELARAAAGAAQAATKHLSASFERARHRHLEPKDTRSRIKREALKEYQRSLAANLKQEDFYHKKDVSYETSGLESTPAHIAEKQKLAQRLAEQDFSHKTDIDIASGAVRESADTQQHSAAEQQALKDYQKSLIANLKKEDFVHKRDVSLETAGLAAPPAHMTAKQKLARVAHIAEKQKVAKRLSSEDFSHAATVSNEMKALAVPSAHIALKQQLARTAHVAEKQKLAANIATEDFSHQKDISYEARGFRKPSTAHVGEKARVAQRLAEQDFSHAADLVITSGGHGAHPAEGKALPVQSEHADTRNLYHTADLAALTAELKPAAQPVHAVIAQLGDVQHEADVRTVVSQLPLVRVDAQLPKAAARDWDHQADLQFASNSNDGSMPQMPGAPAHDYTHRSDEAILTGKLATIADHRDPFHTKDIEAEFNAHRTTVLADDVGHDWDHTKDANAVNSAFQSQHTDYNEKVV